MTIHILLSTETKDQHRSVDCPGFTSASSSASPLLTSLLSSLFAFNMARRASVKSPLVSFSMTSSSSCPYSEGTAAFQHNNKLFRKIMTQLQRLFAVITTG